MSRLPMRILHWYSNYLRGRGGGVANEVLGLATSQARAGAEVIVAAADSAETPLYGPQSLETTFTIVKWQYRWSSPLPAIPLRWISSESIQRLRDLHPDIVHVHGEFNIDNLWPVRVFDSPVILSPCGAFHPAVFSKGRQASKRTYFNIARRLLYERLAAFHAVCPMEYAQIKSLGFSRPIYCAPLAPIMSVHPRPKETATGGAVTLLFVGRLDVYTKGLDILLEAFTSLRKMDLFPLKLVLAGPDWRGGMRLLRQRAREFRIEDRVVFTGPLNRSAVDDLYSQADLYVQLSRHDSFSLTVAEALLMGIPVIVSDEIGIASYPEVRGWPHVTVVPPRPEEATAALAKAIHGLPELRRAAGRSASDVRLFFSWPSIATTHLQAYAALTSPTRNTGAAPLEAITKARSGYPS